MSRKPIKTWQIWAVAAVSWLAYFIRHSGVGQYAAVAALSITIGAAILYWLQSDRMTNPLQLVLPVLVAAAGLGFYMSSDHGRTITYANIESTPIIPPTVSPTPAISESSPTPCGVTLEQARAVQTLAAKYSSEIAALRAVDPATLAVLSADPNNLATGLRAADEVAKAQNVSLTQAVQEVRAVQAMPKADLAFLMQYGPALANCPSREP